MSNFDDIFSGENQSFFNSGSEFPSFESLDLGAVSNITFDDIQGNKSIREINNEYALNNSPFGKNSLFRSVDYTGKNIDFVKLTDFIKANKDAEFDYRRFIGSTEKQVTHYVSYGYEESKFNRMSNIPNSYTTTEVVDTEVPLLVNKDTPGERALQLKGKLYDEKGVVNIRFDSQQDLTGRIEFQFNLGDSVYYKLHFYYVGEERVLEKENKGSIAFTIYSSSFEDFESMLILCGYYVPDKLYEIVDSTFTKALDKVSKESDVDAEYEDNHAKFRRLDWLYENMPAFVARYLDFNQTIDNVFKLSSWDRRLFLGHDTTQAIVNIISKLNSEQVYKYFYDNPEALINLYGGFDDEDLIKQFCQYLTAITFIYGYKSPQDIEKALAKARVFQIGGDAHIETNILYGDEKGKVGLTNELDTFGLVFNTSPNPSASLIAFFYDDIEINKPSDSANKSNQFHPLDLIYIKKTDGVIGADDVNPAIALYGKYLGDKGEWDDIKLAASITADVISIVLSGGAVSLAARIYAIIDVSVSVINIASSFPAVRKELEKTEGGRWFLTNWPIIDLCFSGGTISYYLAKGIIKYSNQLRRIKGNEQFIKKVDDLVEESEKVVDSVSYKALDDIIEIPYINGFSKEKILSIPKGLRPDPSKYLKAEYIVEHIKEFEDGVSFFTNKSALSRYGTESLGFPDNTQFVMTKKEMDNLLEKAEGKINVVETELGIPNGAWANEEIIRVDIPNPANTRIPSGNEMGANPLWIPGGRLPTGYREAVINKIKKGEYKLIETNLK